MTVIPTNRLHTQKFEIYILKDNIVYLRLFIGVLINLEDVKQVLDYQNKLSVDDSFYRIVHIEKYGSITNEARKYLEINGLPAKREAYVLPTLPQKLIFNLYQKFRKRKHPLKGFHHISSAKKWLFETKSEYLESA